MRRLRTIAAAAALALVVPLLTTGPAGAAVDTASSVDPYPGTFTLQSDMSSLRSKLAMIDSELGSVKRPVDWIMDHADRARTSLCHWDVYKQLVEQDAFEAGFCWGAGSSNDDGGPWKPQGITSTRDALSANTYDDHQLLAVSWYRSGQSRMTLVDWDSRYENTYRHILFVEPTGTSVRFRDIGSHAGGMMWYGHLLYVADSAIQGFRVFDFRNIYSADTGGYCADRTGRVHDGTSYRHCANGYAYIMPQVGWVKAPSGSPYLRVSTVSLDRSTTPDSMVVAEFASPDEGRQSDAADSRNRLHPRFVRWSLDYTTRLPMSAYSVHAYSTNIQKVQGIASRDGTVYLASSNGSAPGFLRSWHPSTDVVRRTSWVIGAESLSYWGDSPDLLWTCTERPNERLVVAARPADLDL